MSSWKLLVYFLQLTPLISSSPFPRQETDKATIDVEAQDDGILAKIIVCISFSSFALSEIQ